MYLDCHARDTAHASLAAIIACRRSDLRISYDGCTTNGGQTIGIHEIVDRERRAIARSGRNNPGVKVVQDACVDYSALSGARGLPHRGQLGRLAALSVGTCSDGSLRCSGHAHLGSLDPSVFRTAKRSDRAEPFAEDASLGSSSNR